MHERHPRSIWVLARGTLLLPAAVVTLAGVAGCGERHQVAHDTWTLFDIKKALDAGGNVAMGTTLPAGMPASAILTRHPDGTATLAVVPAFSEGQPAAFVTTEIWINYDRVWLQPGFLEFGGTPLHRLTYPDGRISPLIVDVGPDSTFYSPFWQLSVAVVGEGDPDRYRSTRAIREAGVPIQPAGTSHVCPLHPNDVVAAPPGGHLTEPTWNTELDDIPAADAVFDGQKLGVFDFGERIFSANAASEIEALPFFLFVGPNAVGAVGPVPMAYRVAGVGPLFSGRPADVATHAATGLPQPRFGAFWRVILALVPASAGPFSAAENLGVAPAGVDLKDYEGRVALDTACFVATDFPTGCAWLDSQARIEAALGAANLIPTEIMGTCPLVFYNKKPVRVRP